MRAAFLIGALAYTAFAALWRLAPEAVPAWLGQLVVLATWPWSWIALQGAERLWYLPIGLNVLATHLVLATSLGANFAVVAKIARGIRQRRRRKAMP